MRNSENLPIKPAANAEPADYSKNLRLNVVTFSSTLSEFTCSFYRMPNLNDPDVNLHPLNENHVPSEYDKQDPLNPHSLYTDFTFHDDAPIQLTINPKETNTNFLKAYYLYKITKFFRDQKIMVNRNFISNPEIWIKLHEEDQPNERFTRFYRYGLRMHIGKYTESDPELLISYKGTSDVLKVNMSKYSGDQEDLKWVINQTPERVYYPKVIEQEGHRPKDYYPIITPSVRKHEKLYRYTKRVANRYKLDSGKIRTFFKTHIKTKEFKETTSLTSPKFFSPPKKHVNRVDISNHEMVFGNQETNEDPYFGLTNSGPYRSSSVAKPRILIVAPVGEENNVKQKLINPFIEGVGQYSGVQSMTGLPLKIMETPILYKDRDNPVPEVRQQLSAMNFEPGVQPIAFFFSTIPKHESNLTRREKFYHVKELLLKNDIPSQGIDIQKLKGTSSANVAWWHQHLCAATLAKLGGIPWKVGAQKENELIIGIGAFNHNWSSTRFIGSSFCFDNSGTFRGFDFFDERNPRLLAGSIKKAVQQYLVQNGEAERIVIHYYKQMSYDEQKPIFGAISSLQPGVPIYIVSINKTESRDVLGIDLKSNKRMPLSGTYIHLHSNNYLLFNNHRHYPSTDEVKKHPYPLKLKISEVKDHDTWQEIRKLSPEDYLKATHIPDETVDELMSQIVRFSRMYWKSLNPNPLPVTIEYPSLIAEQVPWFKTPVIPQFGKNIPFFL